MIKILLFLLLMEVPCNYTQEKNSYIYIIKDPVGFNTHMKIIYGSKKVGFVSGLYSTNNFFFGKLVFVRGFKLNKNMHLYKVKTLMGDCYIKIEIDKVEKNTQQVPFQDTIIIASINSQ